MSEEIFYSFSINPTDKVEGDTAQSLIAFACTELIDVDDHSTLVINRKTGQQAIVANNVLSALMTCTTFQSIEKHSTELAATRPELNGNVQQAMDTLKDLDQKGLFLHAGAVAEPLQQSAPADVAATRVFIITCDRPQAVSRLLESMLESSDLTSHETIFLIDDSKVDENRVANAEILENFNIRSSKEIRYIGSDKQDSMMRELIERLPECEREIRFLVDPKMWEGKKTYGRARTLCLLLSVGFRAIVLDDDILCRAVKPPLARQGMTFGGISREARFYASDGELNFAMIPETFNPLEGHASCLGNTLGYAISQLNGDSLRAGQLEGVNATLASTLHSDARILITQNGSWGDPGTGTAHWTTYLDADSVKSLTSSPAGLRKSLEERNCWFGSSRPNIVKMAFMSQMTGLDNTALLPPYFPAFRGEDLLFGAMTERMHPDSAAVEYSWGVPHLPVDKRGAFDIKDPAINQNPMRLLASLLVDDIDYRNPVNPQDNLDDIARIFELLAGRPCEDLLVDYRKAQARSTASQINAVSKQMHRAADIQSREWDMYLNKLSKEMWVSVASSQSPVAVGGLPPGTTDIEVMVEFKRMATGFSEALRAWGKIRDAAALTYSSMTEKSDA